MTPVVTARSDIFGVSRARVCVFGRWAVVGCVRAPRKGRLASETQAGESSRLTEKRRTLMRRLSTAVNLRKTPMVSKS